MVMIQKSTESTLVACDVCFREIPRSEAINAEAGDYVAHFCGLDCYHRWAEHAADDDAEKREPDARRPS
jgi:hypothetical protein